MENLLPTDINISNFARGSSKARRVVAIQLQVGSRSMRTTISVIDSTSNYNVLLERDQIHLNGCVPASLHPALIFMTGNEQDARKGMEIFWADANPFATNVNNIEALLYDKDLGPVEAVEDEGKS